MKLDFNYYVTQLTLIIITITVSLLHVVTLQLQPCISAVTEYRYSVTRGPPGAPVNQVRGQEQGTITPSSGRNPGVWLARLCWGNIGSGYMPMTVSRTEPSRAGLTEAAGHPRQLVSLWLSIPLLLMRDAFRPCTCRPGGRCVCGGLLHEKKHKPRFVL